MGPDAIIRAAMDGHTGKDLLAEVRCETRGTGYELDSLLKEKSEGGPAYGWAQRVLERFEDGEEMPVRVYCLACKVLGAYAWTFERMVHFGCTPIPGFVDDCAAMRYYGQISG